VEKIIELVEVGKVSEAVCNLEESLRQICELRKEKKSTKTFFDYECESLQIIVQESLRKVRSSQPQGIENNLKIYRENRKRYKKMIREKKQCEAAKKEKELIKQFRGKDTHQFWKAVHRSLKGEAHETCSLEPIDIVGFNLSWVGVYC
jgi:uncharacterized membrane protein YgaE (UPF0421/DUF939 family)